MNVEAQEAQVGEAATAAEAAAGAAAAAACVDEEQTLCTSHLQLPARQNADHVQDMAHCLQQQQQQQQHHGWGSRAVSFMAGVSEGFMDAMWSGVEAAKVRLSYLAGYLRPHHRSSSSASRIGDSKESSCEAGGDAFSTSVQHGAPRDVGGVDIQHLLEETLLNVFVEGLFDIHAYDFPGTDGS